MVRIRFNAHIRTIVVVTGGNLIGIYFLYLLYAIYFSITTHLRQGKKVSILVPGDVNSGLVASRRGLLEAVPIVR
jgi:formate/nitrite transporter FocA (FNT family)